ncbi:MAG: hypothetical protein NXI31_02295 [bacterium]|nr:hypothetical protein [bacterium]
MNHAHLAVLTGLALAAAANPQQQATTLARASERAAVIVVATVTSVTEPVPGFKRVAWQTDSRLRGTIGNTFALLEPAGACCGRSLFALSAGERRLLFLERRSTGLHPFGGGRGVLEPTLELREHVAALLSASTQQTRATLLARHLDHSNQRIALDAAHALAEYRGVQLAAADKQRVVTALERAVARGHTTAAALLDVTLETRDPALLDRALALYLAESHKDRARLLRSGLSRTDPARVTARLPVSLKRDPAVELRAAELLRALPAAQGAPALANLLGSTSCPKVKLCAVEGLLAAGHSAGSLKNRVPSSILELAKRRTRAARFRSIRPTPSTPAAR